MKSPILVLVHRIPYPPDKGDKLRAWQWLQRLAQTQRVYLGCFVDDEADMAAVPVMRQVCAGVRVARLNPRIKRVMSLAGLVAGRSLTEGYFFDAGLNDWVTDVIKTQRIEKAFVYCSAMAQYVLPHRGLKSFMDFVDVDSLKWAQYADAHPLLGPLYRRESRCLLSLESRAARQAQSVFFVTDHEAKLFREASGVSERIHAVGNGVDAQFFNPEDTHPCPFGPDEVALVFTGVMDYWPNVDAVIWFVQEVVPRVAARHARVRFYVVGMRPTPAVRALASHRVVITGRVPDVRPYLRHAAAAVAPLRVARGVQNKVLEAMAMACPVVASATCAGSVRARPGDEFEVAQDAAEFAAACSRVLGDETGARGMGARARARVLRDYTWDAKWREMTQWLGGQA